MNFNKHTEQELLTILKHEFVHTKSFHSLDILLIEIWMLFSWFNPISWLLKKAIKVNIEFIADHAVIRQGISYQQYQKSLLDFAIQTQHIPLTNQFGFISLKSRIIMMNKKQSSKKQLGMYFLIVPSIIASLFVFGISKAYQVSEPLEILLQEQSQQNDIILDRDTVQGEEENIENQIIVKEARRSKGTQLLIRGVGSGSEFENALIFVDGVQRERRLEKGSLNLSPKEIESMEVFKGESATAIYGEKGENGVILITTKAGEKAKGEESKSGVIMELRLNKDTINKKQKHLKEYEDLLKKLDGVEVDKDGNIKVQGNAIKRVRINGKEVDVTPIPKADKNEARLIIEGNDYKGAAIKVLEPRQVKSVDVLKGEEDKNRVIDTEVVY